MRAAPRRSIGRNRAPLNTVVGAAAVSGGRAAAHTKEKATLSELLRRGIDAGSLEAGATVALFLETANPGRLGDAKLRDSPSRPGCRKETTMKKKTKVKAGAWYGDSGGW